MKRTVTLLAAMLVMACGKKNDPAPDKIEVIYEVETQVALPFDSVEYSDENSTPGRNGMIAWTVSGIGTFQKHGFVTKGSGAFLSAQHPNSDKWKLRIRKLDGTVLTETTTINFSSGNPSSYYARCQVKVN